MKNKTRRTESGKMLLDVTKYILTVTSISSFISTTPNWPMGTLGLTVAVGLWALGYFMIPVEKGEVR